MKRKSSESKFEELLRSILLFRPKIIFDDDEVEASWKELEKKINALEKREQIAPNHRSDS